MPGAQRSTPDHAPDGTQLSEVLTAAAAGGFDGSFDVTRSDGEVLLRCSACGTASPPATVDRVWTERLEGASDPADMLHVSALRCPACGAGGTLIAHYGPGADDDHQQIIARLPRPSEPPPAVD